MWTDPALTPTFPEDILYILCTYTRPTERTLALAYYNTVSPPLSSDKVLYAYFLTLCRINIVEAYHFARSQPSQKRSQLLERLIVFVVDQKHGERKAKQSMELVSLPFDKEEEETFRAMLQEKQKQKSTDAADILKMRHALLGNSSLRLT